MITKEGGEKAKMKEEKGVTLLALGILIVILMIISGITISMLTSDHGIINEATDAQLQTEVSKLQEITEVYVRAKGIEKSKEKGRLKMSLEGTLTDADIVTKVETTEGLH